MIINEWYTRPKARQLPGKLLHCLYIEMQTFPYLPGSLYEVSRVQWPQTNCIKPTTIKRKNGKCILACRQTEYFGYTKTPRFKLTCWKEILALGTYMWKRKRRNKSEKYAQTAIIWYLFSWHSDDIKEKRESMYMHDEIYNNQKKEYTYPYRYSGSGLEINKIIDT